MGVNFQGLPECAEWGIAWLRDHAWPLWLRHGVDPRTALFHEHLHHDTLSCTADFRRLRVAARQTYVFATAVEYGVPEAEPAVACGLAFLQQRARTGPGRYAVRFALDGTPTDRTIDLYDQSFVLLAYAAAGKALGTAPVAGLAAEVGQFIDRDLAHARIGYEEGQPPARPRRQNPHMHLLEASLAAYETFREPAHLDRSAAIVALFLETMFQWREGALPEFFSDTLLPLRTADRFEVEPGHHYEWVWLLDWYARLAGAQARHVDPRIAPAIVQLLSFADGFGLRPTDGFVVDGLRSDGTVSAGGARLWPQTERIKAEIRRPGDDATRIAGTCAALSRLSTWFDGAPAGLWRERIDAHGNASREPSPASSLYHITCALVDLDRQVRASRERLHS
jgi:mannose/cellobiose epimerase-like protein (N-acyl-D-glucosamine 2-epimerase family)